MYLSILLVRVLLSELRHRGLDELAFLRSAGFDPATLADAQATIPLAEWAAMLARAVEFSGDPAFGIAMAEHWSQSKLQVLGQLIASCRTLREAYALFDRYRLLIGNDIEWTLEEHGERLYLFCDQAVEHPIATRVCFEALFGVVLHIVRNFVRVENGTSEIWFKHAEPHYVLEYARVFDCAIRFGQPRYAIVSNRAYLDQPQPLGDQTVRDVLTSGAEQLLRQRDAASIAERVRSMLQFEDSFTAIDVQRIAAQLGLNVRALRRRLRAERVSVAELLNEARLRIARRELGKPDPCIKEIADRLGFSEPSAFHRAFKRWSGQTPAQYVRQVEVQASEQEPDSRPSGSEVRG